MSGIKFLLDTNFVLGLLKATPEVVHIVTTRDLTASSCAYSAVTRMELLGFSGITDDEEKLISSRLSNFTYLSITVEVEDVAIVLRRSRKVKLPYAIIAATARQHNLELLSLDKQLLTLAKDIQSEDKYDLDGLIRSVNEDNSHNEVGFGRPVGKETL
jgi:predicted nucleic acid-binding protein